MPIINVEIVGSISANANYVSQNLADVAGKIFQSGPGQTWLKLTFIPFDNYAENNIARPLEGPTFVSIIMKDPLDDNEKAQLALNLAKEIGQILNRSIDKIHVYFNLEARGRIAFGGKLMT